MMESADRKIDNRFSVAVDLDGVLAQAGEWKGVKHIGDPFPGAREFMSELHAKAYVIIWTCRVKAEEPADKDKAEGLTVLERVEIVTAWLKKHGIPYHSIWTLPGKPYVNVYVDDRAVCLRPHAGIDKYTNRMIYAQGLSRIRMMAAV